MSLISTSFADEILTVTLVNPPANTLSSSLCDELRALFLNLPEKTGIVILTGNDRFFSAGADIKAFSLTDPEANQAYFSRIYALMEAVYSAEIPVIAAVNGVAMGGGLELALCADIRVVDEGLKMGATSANMGLIFCTERLPRLIGASNAMELLLSARVFGAEEAKRLGIAHAVAEKGQAYPKAWELAENYLRNPAVCLKNLKKTLRTGMELPLKEALQMEEQKLGEAFATEEFKQQVTRFLNRKNTKDQK